MTAITTTGGGIVSPETISSFINWIDRGEQTTRAYLTNLRQFATYLRYTEITEPTRNDIIKYREWLRAEHHAIKLDADSPNGWSYRTDSSGNKITVSCKPSTVKNYLRSVCQFFKWAASCNIYPNIAENIHAPKVSTETHRKEALTAAEVVTIERSIVDNAAEKIKAAESARKDTENRMQRSTEQGKRIYAIYLLAVTAGLRTIEIHRANVKDLQTKNGQTVLYIWGKGGTEPDQKKPIAREAAEAIQDYLNARSDHYTGNSPLFVSTGNRSHGKRIATTTISTMIKKAMVQAGFNSDRITAHSLRHTAAQAALKTTDNNIYMAQKYLRHSNPATTEIYLHEDESTEKEQREMAQNIYNYYHSSGGDQTTGAASIEQIITILTPAQLQQLQAMTAKG